MNLRTVTIRFTLDVEACVVTIYDTQLPETQITAQLENFGEKRYYNAFDANCEIEMLDIINEIYAFFGETPTAENQRFAQQIRCAMAMFANPTTASENEND